MHLNVHQPERGASFVLDVDCDMSIEDVVVLLECETDIPAQQMMITREDSTVVPITGTTTLQGLGFTLQRAHINVMSSAYFQRQQETHAQNQQNRSFLSGNPLATSILRGLQGITIPQSGTQFIRQPRGLFLFQRISRLLVVTLPCWMTNFLRSNQLNEGTISSSSSSSLMLCYSISPSYRC